MQISMMQSSPRSSIAAIWTCLYGCSKIGLCWMGRQGPCRKMSDDHAHHQTQTILLAIQTWSNMPVINAWFHLMINFVFYPVSHGCLEFMQKPTVQACILP